MSQAMRRKPVTNPGAVLTTDNPVDRLAGARLAALNVPGANHATHLPVLEPRAWLDATGLPGLGTETYAERDVLRLLEDYRDYLIRRSPVSQRTEAMLRRWMSARGIGRRTEEL